MVKYEGLFFRDFSLDLACSKRTAHWAAEYDCGFVRNISHLCGEWAAAAKSCGQFDFCCIIGLLLYPQRRGGYRHIMIGAGG